MAVSLGAVAFDPECTSVEEKLAEAGGRDERTVKISGMILGESTKAAVEAQLDAILDAASAEDFGAELSLRAGRRLWVRREWFTRAVAEDKAIGSFTLDLAARPPYEEAVTPQSVSWTIAAHGDAVTLSVGGNVCAWPVITLTAVGELVAPSVSDGSRLWRYAGTAPAGSTLVMDTGAGTMTLNGADVTAQTRGLPPRLNPGEATLTYAADGGSHAADAVVSYRERWW
jgi:hypothetical protein